MAKHKNKYANQKNSFKNNNASKNAGGQFSGKKSNSSNYSQGSVSSGSMSSSGIDSTSGVSSSSSVSGANEGSMLGQWKSKIGEVATVDNLKSNLPAIGKWTAIAAGAVGAYLLYKNRAKISAFIEEQDFSLPFLKGSEETSVASTSSRGKGKSRLNTVSTNTH
jgi:hypothetical protein